MAQHKLRAPSAFLKGRIDKGDQLEIIRVGKASLEVTLITNGCEFRMKAGKC